MVHIANGCCTDDGRPGLPGSLWPTWRGSATSGSDQGGECDDRIQGSTAVGPGGETTKGQGRRTATLSVSWHCGHTTGIHKQCSFGLQARHTIRETGDSQGTGQTCTTNTRTG